MAKPLIYYSDKECKNQMPMNEEGGCIVDWSETIPGQKKEKVLYVKNESKDRLILRQPYSLDEDLKIKDFPPSIKSGEKAMVVLSFEPNKERIDAHQTDWGFDCVVG